ncbi:transcriptional regulator family: Fungal Specific TF [Purpureocillium lilacinum]|uniref:Transcriptional regulator family: Fungal Specific TF n=1 Tax=Purpureocillium lilacinum TaxID=33203 RepID=A0ABR0BY82_PURLI|nr:transcriptional regulator family: Fungal Specific TF [Purpureocillium lilacinum]
MMSEHGSTGLYPMRPVSSSQLHRCKRSQLQAAELISSPPQCAAGAKGSPSMESSFYVQHGTQQRIQRHADVVQTISACNRCRRRKAKCDPGKRCAVICDLFSDNSRKGIPSCAPCQNTNSICEYTDSRTKQSYPRVYIDELEERVAHLQAKIEQLGRTATEDSQNGTPNELSARPGNETSIDRPHPDLVHLEAGGDAHFLGTSSGKSTRSFGSISAPLTVTTGMYLARSVLQSAGQGRIDFTAGESRSLSEDSQQGADGDLASDSDLHHGHYPLPPRATVEGLVEVFFAQLQIQYPILAPDEFNEAVSQLYDQHESGQRHAEDPFTAFMLSMVLSIALLLVSHKSAQSRTMSEGYRLHAMSQLSSIMQIRHYRTLQCLLLLLLSSILNSKSAPMWYISGLCMRMCIDLGFHSERTIDQAVPGQAALVTKDTKRRLFWVTYSLDRALATTLGRPFFINDDEIDVELPETPFLQMARSKSAHWLRLQRLQSEIVSLVYAPSALTAHPTAEVAGVATWPADITARLTAWDEEAQVLADANGHNTEWWRYYYHNALLMLHRPLSRSSLASSDSSMVSYTAAKYMVHHSFIGVHKNLANFTWLDLHTQLTCGLTLLFLVLNDSVVRAEAQKDWLSFKSCIVEWEAVLERLGTRWGRMRRAKQVLTKIADAALDIVEGRVRTSALRQARWQPSNGEVSSRQESDTPVFSSPRRGSSSSRLFQADPSKSDERLRTTQAIANNPDMSGPTSSRPTMDAASTWRGSNSFMPDFVRSDEPWQDSRHQQAFSAANETFTLGYMLADDAWQEAGDVEASQTYVGGFDHIPLGLDSFGLDFPAPMAVPMDTAITDSVLNFLEPVDFSDCGNQASQDDPPTN